MNRLKSIQKRIRLLVAALIVLGTIVGFLVAVPVGPLGRSLLAVLMGGLAGVVKDWMVARDIARLAALEKKENNGPGMILPPGTWLRNVLHVIYPPKIAERVFDQTIADMQLEWGEAMIHDRKLLARWIQVRGGLTVLLTVLAHTVTALGSIFKLVK